MQEESSLAFKAGTEILGISVSKIFGRGDRERCLKAKLIQERCVNVSIKSPLEHDLHPGKEADGDLRDEEEARVGHVFERGAILPVHARALAEEMTRNIHTPRPRYNTNLRHVTALCK